MLRPGLIIALLALPNCGGDETISGYADPDTTYVLAEIDGAQVSGRATIRFPEQGRVTGEAPCNQYAADQTAPYPWFALGPIAATRRACLEGDAEARFFAALEAMSLAEVQGPVLILSTDDGREMVFRAQE